MTKRSHSLFKFGTYTRICNLCTRWWLGYNLILRTGILVPFENKTAQYPFSNQYYSYENKCITSTNINMSILNGNECGNVTVGEKVDIEIVEMWFHHACSCICMDMKDETISCNDKLMQTCVKWKMFALTWW